MLPDDSLDALLRQAKPRAPAGFENQVMSCLGTPRKWIFGVTAILAVASAAVMFLLIHRHSPEATLTWIGPMLSGWSQAGHPLAEGTTVQGPAELASGEKQASISEHVLVRSSNLELRVGSARLRGENIVLETRPARITTLTPDTEVEVDMNAKQTGVVVATAGAAVLTAYVVHGAVRIEAHQPPSSKLLTAGDYALVPPNRSPFVARAKAEATPTPLARRGPTPPAEAARSKGMLEPQSPPIQPPAAAAMDPSPGHLDKAVIRDTIQNHINELKFCYEQEEAKHPNLSGRIVMKFVIREKAGAGRVDEAEIIPGDSADDGQRDLNSPQVEHCVLSALTRWHFPVPEGGGEVRVSYPIIFDTAGKE